MFFMLRLERTEILSSGATSRSNSGSFLSGCSSFSKTAMWKCARPLKVKTAYIVNLGECQVVDVMGVSQTR